MAIVLNHVEVRILGALVEKQVTTPEYYPLTLNALIQACNQKNNRDPVVSFDEPTVSRALEALREKNLVYVFYGSSSRVPKYKHMMTTFYNLDGQELALLTVLMLRGAQTLGELRERASRLYEFSGLEEVENSLTSLMNRESEPLIAKLPRQPGHKEARYAHLLGGEISIESEPSENKEASTRAETDRVTKLEREVEMLAEEMKNLRQQFEDFKNQFS